MTAELRAALRTVAEALPAGTLIPVTREQLLTLLETSAPSCESPSTPEGLLSVEDVSRRLGIGQQWVYRNAAKLGAVKIGRSVKFREQGVERFIQRRAVAKLSTGGR